MFVRFYVVIILLLPFSIVFLNPQSFLFSQAPTALTAIVNPIFMRAADYSNDGIGYLVNAFSIQGIVHKYLVCILSPNNLLQALSQKASLPLFLAFLGMKVSCSITILRLFLCTYRFLFKSYTQVVIDGNFMMKASLLVVANSMVSAVFIYPFPHIRYYLPMVIPTIIALSLYNSYSLSYYNRSSSLSSIYRYLDPSTD